MTLQLPPIVQVEPAHALTRLESWRRQIGTEWSLDLPPILAWEETHVQIRLGTWRELLSAARSLDLPEVPTEPTSMLRTLTEWRYLLQGS